MKFCFGVALGRRVSMAKSSYERKPQAPRGQLNRDKVADLIRVFAKAGT